MTKVKKIKTNLKINKKWWIIAIVIITITLLAQLILPGLRIPAGDVGGIVLYHSPECPLCQDVKTYISEQGISGIIYKDISVRRADANELYNKMIQCGEDVSGGLAIPVLWDNGQCFIGRDEVINHFENMAARDILNQ